MRSVPRCRGMFRRRRAEAITRLARGTPHPLPPPPPTVTPHGAAAPQTLRACLHPGAYDVTLCRYERANAKTAGPGEPRSGRRGVGAAPAGGGHPIAPGGDPDADAGVSDARGSGGTLGSPWLASSPAHAGRLGVRAGRPSRPVPGGGPMDRVARAAGAQSGRSGRGRIRVGCLGARPLIPPAGPSGARAPAGLASATLARQPRGHVRLARSGEDPAGIARVDRGNHPRGCRRASCGAGQLGQCRRLARSHIPNCHRRGHYYKRRKDGAPPPSHGSVTLPSG